MTLALIDLATPAIGNVTMPGLKLVWDIPAVFR